MFERIAHTSMTDFILANNKLDSRSSGFRGGFSTQTALLRVSHDVSRVADEGCLTIFVLFDISQVFDIMIHFKLPKL